MPTITKHKVRKTPAKKAKKRTARVVKFTSVVDRIAPIEDNVPKLSMSFYGDSGTGKTTVACSFPKPLLLIGAEDGTQSVRDVEGVEFVRLDNAEELSDLVRHIPNSEYETVVLDTLGMLYELQFCSILGIEEMPVTGSWGMASREQWQQCNTQVITRLRPFLELHRSSCHVIILAQERVFEPEENYSDLLMPFVSSACTPGVVKWLNPACNYVCQTFIRQKTEKKITKVGNEEITTTKKGKGVEYCLRTAPDPVFKTKFRLPKGAELPDVIVDPDYDKIYELIAQGG